MAEKDEIIELARNRIRGFSCTQAEILKRQQECLINSMMNNKVIEPPVFHIDMDVGVGTSTTSAYVCDIKDSLIFKPISIQEICAYCVASCQPQRPPEILRKKVHSRVIEPLALPGKVG